MATAGAQAAASRAASHANPSTRCPRRYADFKVNEVDLEGNVVRLTSLQPPQVR